MSREVKRVPMDFDWPMNRIWPGFMFSLCGEMEYAAKNEDSETTCALCRQFAHFVGQEVKDNECPTIGRIEVPEGEGWQMWEETSEGSPISPVFATAEELAQWLADSGASAFGAMTATYAEWLAAIKKGWTFGMAFDSRRGIRSGVAFVAENES